MRFQPGARPPNADRTFPGEVYTPGEVRAILAQCSRRAPTGIRDRALITVLYRAGLRLSEALALAPHDVNMTAGAIRVRDGKGHRARTVGIGDGALAVLQLWLDARKRLRLDGARLFCTLAGGPMSPEHVRGMLRRRARKAGIAKRAHPHGLRHSHAFEQAERGTPVHAIQQQLGHSTLAVTSTYLDHIAPAGALALGRADDWRDE